MKKILAVLLALTLALSLAACGSSTNESGVFNLKLAHGLAEDHAVHIALTAWAEKVKEESNGTINIEIFPNGTLGSETDNIIQIRAGALDMTKVSASVLGNFRSEWDVVSVPYVFNDKEHFYKVMDGEIAQELYALTADKGFIGLTWLDSGARSFYTANKAIREPADLSGLKIRTMDSQMAINMMKALGGSATITTYSEVYSSMQTGNIDGAENNITAMRDHSDVTQYYCFDEHTRIPDIIVISTKVWDAMTPEQQEIMRTTAAEMTEEYKTAWADFEDEIRALAEDNGVEFVEDVDIPAFQEACQSIYTDLQTSAPATYEFVEKIQAAGQQ